MTDLPPVMNSRDYMFDFKMFDDENNKKLFQGDQIYFTVDNKLLYMGG